MAEEHFGNNIADLCHEHFTTLPKTGKPVLGKEWTVLAAVLLQNGKGKTDLSNIY